MSEKKRRRAFSRGYKLAVVARLEAGESPTALSRELGIRATLLSDWRRCFRLGGADRLRGAGRPTKAEALAAVVGPAVDLTDANRKIGELERKLGRQELELDFFGRALQRIEGSRRPNDGLGGTASSPTSKR